MVVIACPASDLLLVTMPLAAHVPSTPTNVLLLDLWGCTSLSLWVSYSGYSHQFVSHSSPQRSSLCIWPGHLCGCLVEENDVIFRDWRATCRACWFDSALSQGSVFAFPSQVPLLTVSPEEPSLLAVGLLCFPISPWDGSSSLSLHLTQPHANCENAHCRAPVACLLSV